MSGVTSELLSQLREIFAKLFESVPQLSSVVPLTERLTDWVKKSRSGKLAASLIAVLFARPLVNYAWCKFRGYPPGSIGWIPFFSNLLITGNAKVSWLLSQKKQYGALSMHWIGPKAVVYLNQLELAKKTYKEMGMVCRFSDMDDASQLAMMAKAEGSLGIAAFPLLDGNIHMKRRNLMRDTFMKLVNSDHLNQCIEKWMKETLYPRLDKGINESSNGDYIWKGITTDIAYGLTAILVWTTFGLNLNITVEDASRFAEYLHPRFKYLGSVFAMRSLPSSIMPTVMNYGVNPEYTSSHQKCKEMLIGWINDFRKSQDFLAVKKKPLFATAMLLEIEREKPLVNYEQALSDMNNLFEGGTHITLSNVCVNIYNLVKYPEIQQELYEELVREFPSGIDTLDVNQLRRKCPKLRAFVWESLRLTLIPMVAAPRYVSKEFTLGGYTIPSGCSLMCNSVSINRDCDIWGPDSTQFNINRWLKYDESQESCIFDIRMLDRMVIFSLGKRDCPGKALALNKLAMINAGLLFRYKLESPKGLEQVPILNWGDKIDFFPRILKR